MCQSKHWQLVGSNATSKKISFFDQSPTDESELKRNYCSSYMYTAYYNHNIHRSIRNILESCSANATEWNLEIGYMLSLKPIGLPHPDYVSQLWRKSLIVRSLSKEGMGTKLLCL